MQRARHELPKYESAQRSQRGPSQKPCVALPKQAHASCVPSDVHTPLMQVRALQRRLVVHRRPP
jgi:hypothetical protein